MDTGEYSGSIRNKWKSGIQSWGIQSWYSELIFRGGIQSWYSEAVFIDTIESSIFAESLDSTVAKAGAKVCFLNENIFWKAVLTDG